MVIWLLTALLMNVTTPGRQPQPSADAPFTVVAAVGSQLRVDIGMDASRSRLLRQATVLTRSGAVPAKLVRLERKCEAVCDDKVCHFEAVLRASRSVNDAVGVLPGTPRIESVTTLKPGADQPIDRPEDWINAGPITEDGTSRYSWERFPDGVFLSRSDYYGRDFYSPAINLSDCTVRPVSPFTVIACPTAQVLYESGIGITASFADYGEQLIEPAVRFRLKGKDAVLMRLGLKSEVVAALLVKDQGEWRLTYRDADYPTLC